MCRNTICMHLDLRLNLRFMHPFPPEFSREVCPCAYHCTSLLEGTRSWLSSCEDFQSVRIQLSQPLQHFNSACDQKLAMALLNIGASNKDDAFYRYKMPRLVTKIEGRGNGIKTNLVNMVDVAKALARPPSYTTKFFGCELGAQSKFDEKSATAIVNGAHDATKLAALLETFIKKYVQCYGCGNPETEIVITKSQLISLKCTACGFVSNVDMRDKLTTFILKNPPEQKKGGGKKGMRRAEKERLKEGEALDEEIKQSKKGSKKKKGHDDDSNANRKKASGSDEEEHSSATSQTDQVDAPQNVDGDNDDEVEWLTDTSFQAAQQRIQEQLTVATSEMVVLNTGSEEQESNGKTVTSKGSLKKETDEESGVRSVNETTVHVKLVRDFKECLERGYNAHQLGAHLWIDRPNVSQQEAVNAYFEALFAETIKGVGKEAAKKKSYLATVKDNAQGQELLLGAVEAYFVGGPAERRKEVEVAGLLKILYDTDVLEEEPILAWYDVGAEHGFKSEADQVKKLATRFVDWLRNAESEDED